DNGDVTLTHAANSLSVAGGDLNVEIIDGQTINLDGDGSPTADILTVGSGDTSVTDGVDALQLTFTASNASGNVVDITPSVTNGGAGVAETYNVFDVDAFTATSNTNAGNTLALNGLNFGTLTQTETLGTITATALNIGTGWDTGLSIGDNTTEIALTSTTATITVGTGMTTDSLDINGNLTIHLNGTQTSVALCGSHTGAGGAAVSNVQIVDCTGTPAADYAEQYPIYQEARAAEPTITYGDIVVPGTKVVTQEDESNGQRQIVQLVKSSKPYQGPVAGIVSNNYGDFTSAGYNIKKEDNPMPVALVGRVPVNVTNEGGAIAVGDFVTTSSTAGKGMKATKKGRVIGMALGAFDGTSGQVMVQVINTWYDPEDGGDSAASAKDFFVENRLQLGVETVTVADDGVASNKALSVLTPSTSYVEIKCEDSDGCNLQVEETNARAGDLLYLASIGAGAVEVADRAGVLNGTNPLLAEDDTAMYIYTSGKANNLWVQLSHSDN
ncbi:hypothetical protein HY623_01770, partial [Candidatus Uhrbacteria bacterium]|nr:hypothetical protein [Candidatus Uhrbacteria bacterium]